MQCLIRRHCQQGWLLQLRRDPCGSADARRQEQIDETINPLVANRGGGSQHQGGLIEPSYYLKTDDSLSRSWRGDQVQPLVVEVAVKVPQQPGLVDPPFLSECHRVPEGLRSCGFPGHQVRIICFASGLGHWQL